jgi:cell division protein FtsW
MKEQTQRRTTRGLNSLPPSPKPKPVRTQPGKKVVRHRIREGLFTLGIGLDLQLLVLVLILLAIGLVMLFSSSYAYSFNYYGDSFYFIRKQGIFAAAGIIVMLLVSTFNYHKLHQIAFPLFIVTTIILLMVLALKGTSMAPIKGGANRWINIGGLEFQPSEIAKFSLVVMLADIISRAGDEARKFRKCVLPCLACVASTAGLIIAEKHISATIIIILITIIIMIVGGVGIKIVGSIIAIGSGVVIALVLFTDKFSYANDRLAVWLNPFDPAVEDASYQIRQSLYAIGSGQIFGVGLGQSRQKYLYLPEPQNDFIFAIVCEELGLIGALIVIILFALLIWRGTMISLHAKDKFGLLLGIGTTYTVGLQAVMNILVVTNAMPNTGISLPFFSYGGSSLLILLFEMGVLLSVSRRAYLNAETKNLATEGAST